MANKIPVYQDFVINGQILSTRDNKYRIRTSTLQGTLNSATSTNVITQTNARRVLQDSTIVLNTTNTTRTMYSYGDSTFWASNIAWLESNFYEFDGAKINFRSGTDSLNNDLTKISIIETVNHNYDNSQTSWDYWKTRPHLCYLVCNFGNASSTNKIYFAYNGGSDTGYLNINKVTIFVKYGPCDGELTNMTYITTSGGGYHVTPTNDTLLSGAASLSTYISGLSDGVEKTLCQDLQSNLSENADSNLYVRMYYNSLGGIGCYVSNIKNGKEYCKLMLHYNGSGLGTTMKNITYNLTWHDGIRWITQLTIYNTDTENESTFDENGFNGNGDSSTNKGGGDYDDTQNHIDFPTLPSNNVLNSTISDGEIGLHIYKLNSNLTSFLSNLQSDWTNYYKNIVSINLTKFPISSTSSQPCVVGGETHGSNSYDMLTNQYASINFGNFDFTEYYGSFLDYANTNISIYLPYYSIVQLPTSKIMNGQISVKAYVDYVSGSGRYFIKSHQVLKDFECIIGQYDFNIYNQVPFVASNNSVIGGQILGMCTSAVSGNVGGVLNSAIQMGTQNLDTMYGSIGTTSNVFTNTQPYIIIQRCNTVLPNNYNKNHGYLANITSSVSNLSGYTKINVTKVNGVPEWAETEIIKMLSNGVII